MSNPGLRLLLALLLILAAAPVQAAPTRCPEHFAGGQAPDLVNPRLGAGARALCYRGFSVLHSPASRTALYSAEHLTRDRIESAQSLPRDSEFHPDPGLAPSERAELEDYARSGYDRGHMAPSGDMPDADAQEESFSLANMLPQAPKLNRGTWERIESAVRGLARRRGEIYVVTGPIFRGTQLQRVGNVLVPTHVFKAVLDPGRGLAAAYVAKNVDSAPWAIITMTQLADLTGMAVFPVLAESARSIPLVLPTPAPRGQRRRRPGDAP